MRITNFDMMIERREQQQRGIPPCTAMDAIDGWKCTRRHEHDGEHVALTLVTSADYPTAGPRPVICAVWS